MPERSRTVLLDLTSLAVCLMGFLNLIAVVGLVKSGFQGFPRLPFQVFLVMACAPFLSALWRTPKPPFLIAPLVALFLLYPIAAPHGIVFGRDPIYNFTFTERVASVGFWEPGVPPGLAEAYSLYPVGNVFMAWIVRTASLPGEAAFLWIEPVLRLLAIPTAVYAIGNRIFGPRIAALGLFLYMGTGSILFNLPVQQGIGVIFVALSLLSILMMVQNPTQVAKRRTQVLFALVASGIVMTHHLSSYLFAGWLVGLAVLMVSPRLRPTGSGVRLTVLVFYFIALLNLYILAVSYRIFLVHEQSLEVLVGRLISPESVPSETTPSAGRTFSQLEIAWLGGSVVGLVAIAWPTIRLYRRSGTHSLAVANAMIGAALIVGTLPLIATGQEYVPLRTSEYSNLFVAPFAAASLSRWAHAGLGRWARFVPSGERLQARLPVAAVLVVAAVIFMGGNLAPSTMRAHFEDPAQWNTHTSFLFGADSRRMAEWGRAHYGDEFVWGDHSAIDVFSGFADMQVHYGSSALFVNSTLNESAWSILSVGDYVAVNQRMLEYPSQFFLEPEPPIRAPLTSAQIGKFARDPHFSLVFQDGTFSIYRVMSKPPP